MEIIDPNIPATQPWYVTNGLLVVEMIEGKVQVGDSQFVQQGEFGANVPIAGDPDNEFPTYGSLIRIYRARSATGTSHARSRDAEGGPSSVP